jgi:hypothetical protein
VVILTASARKASLMADIGFNIERIKNVDSGETWVFFYLSTEGNLTNWVFFCTLTF